MTSNTDFLLGIRAAMKFQDSLLKQLSETYGLTLIEANVTTIRRGTILRPTSRSSGCSQKEMPPRLWKA